jgi:hypothetical protein
MLAPSSCWWQKMLFRGRMPIFIINGKTLFNTELVSLFVYRLLRCSSFPVPNLRYSEWEHRKVTALYTLVCSRTLRPVVKLTALGFVREVHLYAFCNCCRIHNDWPSNSRHRLVVTILHDHRLDNSSALTCSLRYVKLLTGCRGVVHRMAQPQLFVYFYLKSNI